MIDNSMSKDYIVVKYEHCLYRLCKSNILLVETTKKPHYIRLVSKEYTMEMLGKIKDYEAVLGSEFIRLSASCIVNKTLISVIDIKNREVILSNEETRTISVRNMMNVKQCIS